MDRQEEYWMTDDDVKRAEFAPGIADRNVMGHPEMLQPGSLVPYVVQEHDAQRAGLHKDIRAGKDKMLSWATRKELPKPGEKPIAIYQQPAHDESYARYQGTIKKGYGAGVVRTADFGKVLITHSDPNKIKFTVAHHQMPEDFTLVRMQGKDGKKPAWLMMNTTPTETIPYEKEHYKSIPAEQIDKLFDPSYVMSSKIDGAAAFLKLMKDKVDVLSYRTSKKTGGPIVHTHRMGLAGQKFDIPKELQNTLLRGEIYGTRGEKSIPAAELGGLLNSSLENSLNAQQRKDIQLRMALFGAKQVGGKPWEGKTHEETRSIIQDALKHLPPGTFSEPPYATTEEEKRRMWESITGHNNPLTREGVVGFPVEGGTPSKAKPVKDYDVHIREIFPQVTGDPNRAGGFTYSLEPQGPVVGKVGGGIKHEERKRMLEHPEEYIGRVARITSPEQFPSGAYRAPTYIARHEDIASEKAASGKTEAVDFDGTLAAYHGWKGIEHTGDPIPKMVDRVKRWLKAGKEVKIFTARACEGDKAKKVIEDWCAKHLGQRLEVTNEKTPDMHRIWDDRAVAIERNTGEKQAELTLVSGYLGAGKSTVAKKMAKDEGGKYVSIDVLRSKNRDKSLKEFMTFLGEQARAAAESDENVIMEGIHASKLPQDIIALAKRVVKVPTPEAEATVRAIDRNLKRTKDPESKMYGWPTMKVVKNVVDNQIRFRKDVENFGQTKSASIDIVEDKDPDTNSDHKRFSAVSDGRRVGSVVTQKLVRSPGRVELSALKVEPEHQGKGIASSLVKHVRSEYKSADLVVKPMPFSDKTMSLDALKSMYTHMGFTPTAGREMLLKSADFKAPAFKHGLEAATTRNTPMTPKAPLQDLVAEAQPAPVHTPITIPDAAPAQAPVASRPTPSQVSEGTTLQASPVDQYAAQAAALLKRYPKSPITGQMMASAWDKAGRPNWPATNAVAQAALESGAGMQGRNPINNPFNVGEFDKGTTERFPNTAAGVQAYYQLMADRYLKGGRSPDELTKNFVDASGRRYASNPKYEQTLGSIIASLNRFAGKGSAS